MSDDAETDDALAALEMLSANAIPPPWAARAASAAMTITTPMAICRSRWD
ncbi:hypothetical protein ACIRBZ_36030 [Streptomyces sp. NPDC094038]